MPQRILRCDDERWAAYQAAADAEGTTLSAWIRATLDLAVQPKPKGRKK